MGRHILIYANNGFRYFFPIAISIFRQLVYPLVYTKILFSCINIKKSYIKLLEISPNYALERAFQSFKKASIPLSVNGWWNKPINTLYGIVAICAPLKAASVT